MRGLLSGLILLAVSACYDPTIRSGEPCAEPAGVCPGGQACIAGFCRTSGGVVPDAALSVGDHDGDGVLDDRDNCAGVANADQANEDGDRFGDLCDPCPQVADDAPADGDGDGIADACDPDPQRRGSVWLFAGLSAGRPGWLGEGAWAAAGDHDTMQVTAPGGNNDEAYLVLPLSPPGGLLDSFALTVALTVAATAGNSEADAGLSVFNDGAAQEINCMLVEDTGTPARRLVLDSWSGSSRVSVSSEAFAWQTGAPYTLTLARQGASSTCTASGPSSLTLSQTSSVVPRAGDAASLWAFGLTERIDWVYVAGTP